jgi:hypothetical protein
LAQSYDGRVKHQRWWSDLPLSSGPASNLRSCKKGYTQCRGWNLILAWGDRVLYEGTRKGNYSTPVGLLMGLDTYVSRLCCFLPVVDCGTYSGTLWYTGSHFSGLLCLLIICHRLPHSCQCVKTYVRCYYFRLRISLSDLNASLFWLADRFKFWVTWKEWGIETKFLSHLHGGLLVL